MTWLSIRFWWFRCCIKFWCKRHLVRPVLKWASRHGMIAGRART